MSTVWTQIRNVALTITVLSAFFFVLNIGVGETYNVIADPSDASAATNATYGGNIDFTERIGTLGMVIVALGPAGLGAIAARGNGARAVDTAVQYALPIVALLAAVNMTDTVIETIQGDRVWDNFTDAENSWVLGNAAALVAGVTGWLRMRN